MSPIHSGSSNITFRVYVVVADIPSRASNTNPNCDMHVAALAKIPKLFNANGNRVIAA